MARQRRSAPAPRTQTRSAHTAAAAAPPPPAAAPHYPPAHAQPVQQTQQPGLFAQMASTAAGVAVGSAVGHTIGAGISGMFGGSSSSEAAPAPQQQVAPPIQQTQQYQEQAKHCDADARSFTRCLEDNGGNMQICDYYLQQLKACQEAAKQY